MKIMQAAYKCADLAHWLKADKIDLSFERKVLPICSVLTLVDPYHCARMEGHAMAWLMSFGRFAVLARPGLVCRYFTGALTGWQRGGR